MKTAVDSSILLDVFSADPIFGTESREALRRAFDEGALVACEVVFSEVRANFEDDRSFDEALSSLGVRFEAMTAMAAAEAGRRWRDYCLSHKKPRARVVADFLVAAHALRQADALLWRDRGFYRPQFMELELVGPGQR